MKVRGLALTQLDGWHNIPFTLIGGSGSPGSGPGPGQ